MFDHKQNRRPWIAALLLAAAAAGSGMAQEVKDLTSSDPTEEQLIEILKPKAEADGVRGIGVTAKPRAKCSLKQTGGTRGIGVSLKPISDVAAIHIQFAFNSAEIAAEASTALDRLGKALTSPMLSPSCFQIKGHTDSIGSDRYNDRLSQRRAEAVLRYLTTHFTIEPDRLDAIGLGKNQPIADNSTDEGRSKNRRVEIVNVSS
ncbi:MAG TPA: OmpA family protein [Thermoanaerobaculia bacterium]|nr:OmpA family protein [Thermoanaerobaculia bacterium]